LHSWERKHAGKPLNTLLTCQKGAASDRSQLR
jgi:hypothetical protein